MRSREGRGSARSDPRSDIWIRHLPNSEQDDGCTLTQNVLNLDGTVSRCGYAFVVNSFVDVLPSTLFIVCLTYGHVFYKPGYRKYCRHQLGESDPKIQTVWLLP